VRSLCGLNCALPNQRLKLSARGRHVCRKAQGEAIYLVCGARRPQLKRNPLGLHATVGVRLKPGRKDL
jgi:hypothetical protein